MARAGLLDVPGDERRPSRAGRTLRFNLESQLRRAPGRGRQDPPGEPCNGRRRGHLRALRRRAEADMRPFTVHRGLAMPLDRANVDTDAIIPKQFLKSIKRSGFGPNLFDEWRYLDHGEPGMDNSARPLNPDFVLNQARYTGATVLLARENFGCGSSREHAPWALLQYGFQTVIAPSFADIFYNNSLKNGLLLIKLDPKIVDRIFRSEERRVGKECRSRWLAYY